MDITLKNVPEPICRLMRQQATRERRSLNAQIIHTLENEAVAIAQRNRLKRLRKKFDRFAASLPPMENSAPEIRQERLR